MPNILHIPSPVQQGSTPQLYDIETDTAASTFIKPSELHKAVTSINLAKLYQAIRDNNITNFYQLFLGCSGLTGNLDFSGWDISAVTNLSQMFSGCTGITSINTQNWDTGACTDFSNMFLNCGVQNLDLRHFDMSAANTVMQMLNSPHIQSVNVTNWDVSHITNFGGLFTNNGSTEIDLSGWDTSAGTNFGSFLTQCCNLRKIWAPSTFVATGVTRATYKPFYYQTSNLAGTHIYTDAPDDTGLDWGTIHTTYTVHYGATHADYENA